MRIHVFPSNNKWAIKKKGAKRALRVFYRKEEAYHQARLLSNEVSVHNKNGQVEFIYIELVAKKGQYLIAKEDIQFEDTKVLKNTELLIKDIKGFGYDLIDNANNEYRVLNSKILELFNIKLKNGTRKKSK